MNILFLALGQDNANSGYNMMRAAEAARCAVRGYCESKHPLRYPSQLSPDMPHTKESFDREIKWADIIHYIRTKPPRLVKLPNKPTVIQHGDDILRDNLNVAKVFNHLPHAHICVTADLMSYITEKSHLIPAPVDVRTLRPSLKQGRIKIGHFPSIPSNKGTDDIEAVIARVKDKFEFDWVRGGIEPWENNIKRVSELDIYIDQYCVSFLERGDDTYIRLGEQGVATREAAALGVVPISTAFNLAAYAKEYSEHGFVIANSRDELYITLVGLLSLSREHLNYYQDKARKWVVRNHSYEVTGERLLSIYTKLLEEAA